MANSYRKTDAEYNNYTAIEGAFSAHLSEFVDLITLPDTEAPAHASSDPDITDHGPWDAMRRGSVSEDLE